VLSAVTWVIFNDIDFFQPEHSLQVRCLWKLFEQAQLFEPNGCGVA
jgi:hypothetical protein